MFAIYLRNKKGLRQFPNLSEIDFFKYCTNTINNGGDFLAPERMVFYMSAYRFHMKICGMTE